MGKAIFHVLLKSMHSKFIYETIRIRYSFPHDLGGANWTAHRGYGYGYRRHA